MRLYGVGERLRHGVGSTVRRVNRLPYFTSNGAGWCWHDGAGVEGFIIGAYSRRVSRGSLAVFADDVEVIKRRYINFTPLPLCIRIVTRVVRVAEFLLGGETRIWACTQLFAT